MLSTKDKNRNGEDWDSDIQRCTQLRLQTLETTTPNLEFHAQPQTLNGERRRKLTSKFSEKAPLTHPFSGSY